MNEGDCLAHDTGSGAIRASSLSLMLSLPQGGGGRSGKRLWGNQNAPGRRAKTPTLPIFCDVVYHIRKSNVNRIPKKRATQSQRFQGFPAIGFDRVFWIGRKSRF
jgi:hypothetical protein